MRKIWSLLVVAVIVAVTSCDNKEQTITPAGKSARGESCQARNDCASGLACINGTCSKNDFDIQVNSKQCDLVDCESDKDCCGDKPREAPAKCAERVTVCTPTVAGCTPYTYCEANSECGEGACTGSCSYSFTACTSNSNCAENVCVNNACSQSGAYCLTDDTCAANTCINKQCDCDNPEYNPSDSICTDPDCDDLCTLSCEDERCVPDTSCEEDIDCIGLETDICDEGRCVECTRDGDCDEEAEETCQDGRCEAPCVEDEECPLFHACDDGVCVETGCGTDNECILAAARNGGSIEDPRLAKCLPSETDEDINICKIPCENDAACSQFEVCDDGFCVFIGCKTDEECRAYFGLENEETDDNKPYITKALCR